MYYDTTIKQHLQGVLEHGRSMRIFRTFHTINNDGNVSLHALLLTLEERYKLNNNNLPHILYLQIDGGAENVTKIMLALCELLIIRGLVDKVILSPITVIIVKFIFIDIFNSTFGGSYP